MTSDEPRPRDLLIPLLGLGVVVAMVSAGFAHGFWLGNLHNGLLALAFGAVSAWTLLLRPNHPEALLLGVVGVLEGVLFLARQVAHEGSGQLDEWWGWLGVWPLALILGLTTWAVLCFPEGRFLSRPWRLAAYAIMSVAVGCSLLSALWPVEYAAAGVTTPHPLNISGIAVADAVWDVVAHPAYLIFQLTWVVAVVARWRTANGILRGQLALLSAAVALVTIVLLVGLAVAQSPQPGLLTTPLIPVVVGWIIVHLSLGRVIEETRATGGLSGLSPRENEVLDLMAQGLSNRAISEQLHLSIKTVEPIVSSIFRKLDLPADETTNRRVMAVLARRDG